MDPRGTVRAILMRQEWSVERQNTTDRAVSLPTECVRYGGFGFLQSCSDKGHARW